MGEDGVAVALTRLDDVTRRLRRDCPWDREQDERSIVPHTVEEAYELADAAESGDDDKLLDELGDVLFQVYFLSLLLEERGRGDLAAVADHCREKLIRRHPHVFGDERAGSAGEVLRNWNRIKREDERGGRIFGPLPQTLPSTLYAQKVLKRAASAGFDFSPGDDPGDRLLEAVQDAIRAKADPELALRAAADRFRADIERAEEEGA